MATAAGKRAGFTVRGVRFDSPAAAIAAADRLDQEADEGDSIRELRRAGRDGEADKRADQLRATADAYRTAAAEHSTKPGVTPRRRSSSKAGKRKRSTSSTSSASSSRPTFGGLGRQLGSQAGGLVGTVAGPAGSAVSEFVLATVAIAFLTVFLSTSRGPKGFAWLANGAANLVHLIVAPVDPLGGVGSANQGSGSSSTPPPPGPTDTATATPTQRKRSPVVVTSGGPGRRGGH